MKRTLAILMLAAGLSLAATKASAQLAIAYGIGTSIADTGAALVPGVPASVPVFYHFVSAATSYYSYGYRPTALRLTLHFDPARAEVLGVQSTASALMVSGTSSGTGWFTVDLASSGYGPFGTDIVPVTFSVQLLAGATDGAYLWIEPGPATSCYQSYYYYNCYGSYPLASVTNVGQVCHATHSWGDVDGSGQVDSRDALITLSAAVGLPVSGFDLAHGDVDGDGLANSRDALMILSHAIGLAPGGSTGLDRTGVGIADACPGLTPPGEKVVYIDTASGSGDILRLDSLSSTPASITTGPYLGHPRLDAAGASVVFTCPDTTLNSQICVVGADGTGRRRLTGPGVPSRFAPDWSPDGTRIAFLRPVGMDSVFIMDSSGTNEIQIPTSPPSVAEVVWTRDGSQLTYSSGGIWTVALDSAHTVTPIITGYPVNPPLRWSPDGSTLAFQLSDGRIYTVPASGGTPTPVTWFDAPIGGFDWGPQGIIFSMPDAHGSPSLWLLQGGPTGPLVRLTDPGSGHGDNEPSFRRNP